MSYGYFIRKERSVYAYCWQFPEVIKKYLRQRKPYVRKRIRHSKRRVICEELE